MKFELMDSLKRILTTSFGVVPAKSENGVYSPSRKQLVELGQMIAQDAAAARGVESKQRRKCRLIKALKNCVWYELEENPHPMEVDGKLIYFQDDTDGSENVKIPEPDDPDNCFGCMVSHLQIIDDTDPVHNGKSIIFVTTDGRIVGYKLSRRERGRISLKRWRNHAKALRLALETQRNNARGVRRNGCYLRNVLFGWRREGNSKRVTRYVPKPGADEEDVVLASIGVQQLVADLEQVGLNLVTHLEISVQNMLRDKFEMGDVLINGYDGRFSQLALATNYWSPLHTGDDIFRTLLSCYLERCDKEKYKDEILFYFVFPCVGIAIPMRSTDILVFDSKIPHCASNYRVEDAMIFSCFTSAKTTYAHMNNKAKKV